MQAGTIHTTEAPAIWIGIDVSKQTVDAALHLPAAPCASFPRTPAGIADLYSWACEQTQAPLRAVLEATGRYSAEVITWLTRIDPAIAPALINPLHAKRFGQSLGLRNKTDRVDARMLARYGAERTPAAYEEPSQTILELRSLVRERRALVDEQTRVKNRVSEGADSRFVTRERQRQLKQLETVLARFEKEMLRIASLDAALTRDIKRLLTIPGVGFITAATVLAELGDLRRFATSRQIAAFAGLSPRRFESGTSVRGRTRLCKKGNPSVRAVLYMSAVCSSRMEKGMKHIYNHLLANGKEKMSALGAIMRRQLILMRALLVTGQDYREPVKNH